MNVLIIGDKELSKLKKLRDHAEANRIGVDDMLDIFNGSEPPVGDRDGFSCEIPRGYRIVFCIEHQKKGWARHLSISMHPRKPNTCAHPKVVEQIMQILGFAGGFKDAYIYFEQANTVVNVIEYLQ